MKKIILVFAAVAMCISASAQFYVGGTVGMAASINKAAGVSGQFSPTIGYQINDKMAVGADFVFGGNSSTNKEEYNGEKYKYTNSVFNFYFRPYYRWQFAQVKMIRFYLDGIGTLGSSTKGGVYDDFPDHSKVKVSQTNFVWGLEAAPVVAVDVNSHWSILGRIASVGVSSVDNNGVTFGLNVLSGTQLGVVYKL